MTIVVLPTTAITVPSSAPSSPAVGPGSTSGSDIGTTFAPTGIVSSVSLPVSTVITLPLPSPSTGGSAPSTLPGTGVVSTTGLSVIPVPTDSGTATVTATGISPITTDSGTLTVASGITQTVTGSTGGITGPVTGTGVTTLGSPSTEIPSGSDVAASTPISTSVAPVGVSTIGGSALSFITFPTTGPQTIMPTGSDSLSSLYLPSSIIFEPTASSPIPSTATNAPTGIPSALPHIVEPPNGVFPTQPTNTTLIQIGFLYPLNYQFVVEHQLSIAQIFSYLPEGLAYGLSIPVAQVLMQSLQPYDTTETLGYVTTLAFAYIPTIMVDTLKTSIHVPASPLYQNPDGSVHTLMSMINPAFPVLAGVNLDGGSTTATTTGTFTSTASAIVLGGAPLGGGMEQSSSVKGTSVAIGIGVVASAAVYGAAMFFVAQRYKKRRQYHRRSPSLINTDPMAQSHREIASGAATALMSGARGPDYRSTSPNYGGYYHSERNSRGSGRSGDSSVRQQISAPVMAENSLGWN